MLLYLPKLNIRAFLDTKIIEDLNNNIKESEHIEKINRISDSQEFREDLQEKINIDLTILQNEIKKHQVKNYKNNNSIVINLPA